MRLLFIFMILGLLSCVKEHKEASALKSQWEKLEIPYSHEVEALGSMSVLGDSEELHVVMTMKVQDDLGQFAYKLIYFRKFGTKWAQIELKSSDRRFYHVQGGNNQNIFLQLHLDVDSNLLVIYINEKNELVQGRFRNDVLQEDVLDTDVGTFASTFDAKSDELHLTYVGTYPEGGRVKYRKYNFQDNSSEFIVRDQGFSVVIDPGHMEMVVIEGRPFIFFKTINRFTSVGEFIVLSDSGMKVLARGINPTTLFNVYIDRDDVRTCYRDSQGQEFSVHVDLRDLEVFKKKVSLQTNDKLMHCLVTENESLDYVTYDNYQPYNHVMRFFAKTSGEIDEVKLEEIKFLSTSGRTVVAAGLDLETRAPVVYINSK